jgi:hypothetical protein
MTTPTSRAAYEPYYEVLDRALESGAGIRIECADQGAAYQFRIRLHSARQIDRELNRESRQPTDPNYGISDYDKLVVRVRADGDKWWVYIQPTAISNHIEELTA